MPVYQAECPGCGTRAEYLRPVSQYLDCPTCVECGLVMEKKIFQAPYSFMTGRFEPFVSTVDGSLISSARDMREHNKRNNVLSMSDGYSEDALRNMKPPAPTPVTDKKELLQDIQEAAIQVRDGYVPIKQVQTDDD